MFKLVKIENAKCNAPEPIYLTVGATAVNRGQALKLDGGVLVVHGADSDDASQVYIAMADADAGAKDVPVIRVTPDMLFEADTQADCSAAVIGSKVTMHTDGLQVTATTEKGFITVVDLDGASAAGDTIRVRFE